MKNTHKPTKYMGAFGKQLSLLPEPPFCPQWPNPSTHPRQALDRLLTGERLTQPSFGLTTWRLSAYIKELDYCGWPIERGEVANPYGERPIAEYYLATEIIMAAKALRGEA